MVSLSSWVRSMGVGGQLAPFFKSVCVYFVALGASAGEAPSPSPAALAVKCAPVLCLLAALLYRASTLPAHKRRYCALVSAGLALSALGDAALVWAGGAALAGGMLLFGGAHVAYTAAFGWRPLRARAGAALGGGAALYCACVRAPPPLGALLPPYALLLAAMAWRGVARGPPAAAGALLFLLSDALLGYSLFVGRLPHDQVLVMSTYYMGQLGIAYSALKESEDEYDKAGAAAEAPPQAGTPALAS